MTTPSEEFWSGFDLSEIPVFDDAVDLARFSIQTHRGLNPLAKTERSRGALRFTGHGVAGHRAGVDEVFNAGLAFQRLVTAVGSSLKGARTRVSEKAMSLTKLQLDASPEPGSIMINLVSAADPAEELRPRGQMMDAGKQLIDESFEQLKSLLSVGGTPDTADSIAHQLHALGPRTAAALRSFAMTAGDSLFDIDVTWQQPLQPAMRWSVSASDLQFLVQLVEGRSLDEEPVVLNGTLITVSTSGTWYMREDEYGTIALDISSIEGSPWLEHNPQTRVQVDAVMSSKESPGRPVSRSFRAERILRLSMPVD